MMPGLYFIIVCEWVVDGVQMTLCCPCQVIVVVEYCVHWVSLTCSVISVYI